MMSLNHKKIVLGVTGGIAAYKACSVLRDLQKLGASVTVVMTQAATEFVGPLTFEALSQNKVYTDLFVGAERGIAHIELVKQHDYCLVVPATAESIAKFRWGRADDLLSTVFLAFDKAKFIAPAMNTRMWKNSQTQENIAALQAQGVMFIDPDQGELACKDEGFGKLATEKNIVDCIVAYAQSEHSLKGKKILITAGPTREYIDPVRFVSSPSTGTMGYAIAKQAAQRGAEVVLVSGPVALQKNFQAQCIDVVSAQDMFEAVKQHMDYDMMIATAAVADYSSNISEHKIKKGDQSLQLDLHPTQDIVAYLGHKKNPGQIVVAFAAESEHLLNNALLKMQKKNADFIVANEVHQEHKGFGSGKSTLHFMARDQQRPYEKHEDALKSELAEKFWTWLLKENAHENR